MMSANAMMTAKAGTDTVARNARHTESETDPYTVERYAAMAQYLRDGQRVLDIGCNTGRGGRKLKALLPRLHLVGVDLVASRIAALPAAYSSGICSSATEIDAPDESTDAIVAGEFIEHVRPHDVDQVLCEFQRVLKVPGTLVMTTPNPDSWLQRLQGRTVIGGAHPTQHWPDTLSFRLRMHGFRDIRVYGSGKATRYLGKHFPKNCYGSFLIVGRKW